MDTGKIVRGWEEEEERSGQMIWASDPGGGRRDKEEEEVRGGRRVQEVFIKLGSQLRLICNLRRATSKPTFLFWCPPPQKKKKKKSTNPRPLTSANINRSPGTTMTQW